MDGQLRASDEDRHRVVADLQRHTELGRLSLDEFSERVGAVYSARTLGELATVTRDLPAASAASAASASAAESTGSRRSNGNGSCGHGNGGNGNGNGATSTAGSRRELLVVFAVAVATLLLMVIFMAVTR